jgi:hypothetical protein
MATLVILTLGAVGCGVTASDEQVAVASRAIASPTVTQTTTTPAPTVVAVPSPTKEIEIDPACERLQKTFDLATQLAADTITSGNTAR